MSQEIALHQVFGPALANNPTATRECLNLLHIFHLEPETLHSKWEAYIMNKTNAGGDEDESLSSANLEGFKSHLRRTLEQQANMHLQQGYSAQPSSSTFAATKKATIKSRYNQGPSVSATRMNYDIDMDRPNMPSPERKTGVGMPASPVRNRTTSGPVGSYSSPTEPTQSSMQFAQRKNTSEAEETLNGNLTLRTEAPKVAADYRNSVSLVVGVKPYRYMSERITEKGRALDSMIDNFAEIYTKAYPNTEFGNPAYQYPAPVTVIGRICADTDEGKANEQSLVLETSRSLGYGDRVRLDVTEIQGFSFFPGQIVVLTGINSNGHAFAVTTVHEMPALPMAAASPLELEEFQYKKLGGQPLKMITAAGPYTLNDNLLFEPFAALMDRVNKERPDVLLLIGPFISSQHPAILSGNVDMTPEEYFATYISSRLSQHQERYPKEMQILLVPSLQDIIHETIVMPQPEFEQKRSLRLPAGTYCLPNPAQFTINEMVFAVNSTDILTHLSGGDISRNPLRSDRMGRLSKSIIEQRNLHPVFPGLASELESGIDYDQYDLMDLRVCPDIVILPSRLRHFAKTVDNVIMINPNQLCKGQTGGTFAVLTIHPIPREELEDAAMMMDEEDEQSMSTYHRVYDRCRVDLVRV
ncbi:DNA polymerase alpha subunit B [Entomortierella parvispora]|uniref:DNA polymerase alpha subunit B n=1 Tax=Entomortierella parvispora TaxID=205924 RepID=A0A9P3HLW9_9FUNG|nr:DNA polymerase alpha subunit B [Entomortierella parvispora]